ncbi:lysophospholipid acyltransferase family protein [Oceanobacillus sp. 1P07AA]|uniref:lysophospholipid acyltransferase family protein n=1 Tax=Oceanobacillus sp. 1P07AA TaxID=3132293 RepID=UPI0039A67062
MIRTIGIYVYASLLVIGTIFKLQKVKKWAETGLAVEKQDEIFKTPKIVSQKVIAKTGTGVKVEGLEKVPSGPVLFVANHQGIFDILAFLGYLERPVGFIAKKEIKKIPIISTWMEFVHCVFIDRTDRRQSMQAIQQGIENLKDGNSMLIFPEGTRSKGRQVSSFKAGSFRLATKSKVPIVPVSIDGTYQMLEEDGGRIKKSSIHIVVDDPILPEQYEKMKSAEIASNVESTIRKRLKHVNE